MVNILDITNELGETLQINQREAETKEGQERIKEHMRCEISLLLEQDANEG